MAQLAVPLDTTPARLLPVRFLRHLRSNLFIAIVSLLVLTGYGFDLFDVCCARQEQRQVEHGKAAPKNQTPGNSNGCQCICHQITTPLTPEPVRLVHAVFVPADFVAHPDEFPPYAVPLDIDYPPQLA